MLRPLGGVVRGCYLAGWALSWSAGAALGAISSTGDVMPPINVSGNFTTPNGVEVGKTAAGALQISGGSVLESSLGQLGDEATGFGTVTISSSGAWNVLGLLSIGHVGDGTMTVQTGGSVTSEFAEIARESTSMGGLTVNGGSFTTGLFLSVGRAGEGSLAILGTGSPGVVNAGFALLGDLPGGSGTAEVSAGGTWNVSGLLVVGSGGTGRLTVSGGAVNSNFAAVGDLATGGEPEQPPDGEATIDAGGVWTNTGGLFVGGNGRGELTVRGGGEVETGFMEVGRTHMGIVGIEAGSRIENTGSAILGVEDGGDASATVNGTNALWSITDFLVVGAAGDGDLTLSNNGKVTALNSSVASTPTSVSNVHVLSGGLWEAGEFLLLGREGTGSLQIAGGRVTAEFASLGTLSTGVGNAQVTTGGKLETALATVVAQQGTGTLTISSGGMVTTNALGRLGEAIGSDGSATISGAGSKWTVAATLDVGSSGSGELLVQNGGAVQSLNGALARFNTATATASVSGAGSAWQVGNDLNVGGGPEGAGGAATLSASAGGLVQVADMVRVWPSGVVNLGAGGAMTAASIQHTDGGAFNFTGGTLRVGTFTGNLVNGGGTLGSRAVVGATTITGNYTQQAGATLEIDLGGTAISQFDRVSVSGTAMLDGILRVALVNGFVPSLGNSFGILTAAGGFGLSFDSLVLPSLPAGLGWQLNPGGTTLFLNVVTGSTLASADFDSNGAVSGPDLARWSGGFGIASGATRASGDSDGDGDSDGADFLAWQRQFGAAGAAATIAAVPEPASIVMIGAVSGLFFAFPRLRARLALR